MKLAPFLLAALIHDDARAFVYTGNPIVAFRVDRPANDYVQGTVTLDKVRVHHCDDTYTDVPLDDVIDPVEVNYVAIGAGDHCSMTFYWDTVMDIQGDGSLGAFTVRYAQATTSITFDAEIDPVALTPYSVVSGSMSGGSPWLLSIVE